MEPISFFIIAATAISAIGITNYLNNRKRKIRNTLRKAPFKRIGLVEDGQTVTIAGNVVLYKRFMEAPLSSRKCVYYHATVARKKSSGKNSSKWITEIDEAASVNFLIDDGRNLALVDANAIEGFLEMDEHYKSGMFKDTTPVMERFLNKYQIKSKTFLGSNKRLRYKEGALEEHEYCIVCGTCFWANAKDYDISGHNEILVIKASDEQPVFVTDVKDVLL